MLTRTFLLAWYSAMITRIDKAGDIIKQGYSESTMKTDMSIVTDADIKSHDILTVGWTQTSIISEETYFPQQKMPDVITWVDPLDATQEYSEGLNKYVSIMACLTENGQPKAGILHFPFTDETWAVIGNEWLERPALTFNPPQNIIVSRSHAGDVKKTLQGFDVTIAGGSGYKTAQVLKGNNLAYVHTTNIKTWDICAPDAFIRATNGTFVEWETGKPFNYTKVQHTGGIFASTTASIYWFRMVLVFKNIFVQIALILLLWVGIYSFPQKKLETVQKPESTIKLSFLLCTLGLISSFVIWAIAKERIMTIDYDGEKFQNPSVLIFLCRLLSSTIAGHYVLKQSTPLYKLSFASISNVISSLCAYTALNYTVFPIVVIFKSLKMIPVLLMGTWVFKKRYKPIAYILAGTLSVGVAICLFSRFHESQNNLSLFGIILMLGYVISDAFTSQWQNYIYKEYATPSLEMMWGVNTCSVIFTGVLTFVTGQLDCTIDFAVQHPVFVTHVALLCIPAVIGQLFIFKTIELHGAASFAMIMTGRQAITLITSCIIFGHKFDMIGIVGITIVIGTLIAKNKIQLEKKNEYEKVSLEEDIETSTLETHND